MMSQRRYHFSWGHHFRRDCPLNVSQQNCHIGSGTGKFCYSSASAPWRHHFSLGYPFNWGHSCIVSQLNSLKGSGTGKFSYSSASAILATLAGAQLFPCSSTEWTTVFYIVRSIEMSRLHQIISNPVGLVGVIQLGTIGKLVFTRQLLVQPKKVHVM